MTDSQISPDDPQVWVETTKIQGHKYRQRGDYELGSALVAPAGEQGESKTTEAMREASVGDIVIHLLEDKHQLIAISTIESELERDFEIPDSFNWTQEKEEEGALRRWLTGFEKLREPIDAKEDILEDREYESELHAICTTNTPLFFTSELALAKDEYLTKVPPALLSILVYESAALQEALATRGYPIATLPTGQLQPVDRYETVSEATADIKTRLEKIPGQQNRLQETLVTTIVDDWTDAVTDFRPEARISPEREISISQIKQLYALAEPQLQGQAQKLDSGTIADLDETQTLFVALLRDLQEQANKTPNVTPEKIRAVLLEQYTVAGETEESDIERELPTWCRDKDPSVHVYTAPPEFWLTALERGAIGFSKAEESDWKRIQTGDILIWNTTGEPQRPEIRSTQNGIIGACIAGEMTRKEESWWWAETKPNKRFPHLLSFQRLFVTGQYEDIDTTRLSVGEKEHETLESELRAITEDNFSIQRANEICEESAGVPFPTRRGLATLTSQATAEPSLPLITTISDHLSEVSPRAIHRPFTGVIPESVLDGLYFPDGRKRELVEEIGAALRGGKHLIFTGPPGTGKTEIARQIADYMVDQFPYLYSGTQMTTATADWSTFDTVGGYMPETSAEGAKESLSFTPGVILKRLKDTQAETQLNEPVIIDEINRADIDKAFGQLFTTLSGQSVTLPFKQEGSEIELHSATEFRGQAGPHQYVVPRSWRIFATMNTYDKTSLYEMSYAFMRRFAFIRVGVPELPRDESKLEKLVGEYVVRWDDIDSSPKERRLVGMVWSAVNAADGGRQIGPAIIHDILAYLESHESMNLEQKLTQAVISYVFPQLEGVPKRRKVLVALTNVSKINTDLLDSAAQEMLNTSPLSE